MSRFALACEVAKMIGLELRAVEGCNYFDAFRQSDGLHRRVSQYGLDDRFADRDLVGQLLKPFREYDAEQATPSHWMAL